MARAAMPQERAALRKACEHVKARGPEGARARNGRRRRKRNGTEGCGKDRPEARRDGPAGGRPEAERPEGYGEAAPRPRGTRKGNGLEGCGEGHARGLREWISQGTCGNGTARRLRARRSRTRRGDGPAGVRAEAAHPAARKRSAQRARENDPPREHARTSAPAGARERPHANDQAQAAGGRPQAAGRKPQAAQERSSRRPRPHRDNRHRPEGRTGPTRGHAEPIAPKATQPDPTGGHAGSIAPEAGQERPSRRPNGGSRPRGHTEATARRPHGHDAARARHGPREPRRRLT